MMLYECGVRYERTMENGMTKKVTELYLVDALSFAEAEGRITNEMEPYISGEFDVVTIKRTNISEIVEGLSTADKWFKAKLMYITIDEKTGKEKKQAVHFIVRASDINNAHICVVCCVLLIRGSFIFATRSDRAAKVRPAGWLPHC